MADLPESTWFATTEKTAPNGGTAEAVLVAVDKKTVRAKRGVIVQALAANTNPIYVGPEGVTSSTGLELAAGDSFFLPVQPDQVFCVSTAAGQKLHMTVV